MSRGRKGGLFDSWWGDAVALALGLAGGVFIGGIGVWW